MMKSSLLFFLLFTFQEAISQSDSIRIKICESSGTACYGFPAMTRTVEYLDSIGRKTRVIKSELMGCDGSTPAGFTFGSESQYTYTASGKISEDRTFSNPLYHVLAQYEYDSLDRLIRISKFNGPPGNMQISGVDTFAYHASGQMSLYYKSGIVIGTQWDTIDYQYWLYDTADRLIYHEDNNYNTGNWSNSGKIYYEYDSLSRLINQYDVYISQNDSIKTEIFYDSLNRVSISNKFEWNSVSGWDAMLRDSFVYSGLMTIKYTLQCFPGCDPPRKKLETLIDSVNKIFEYYNFELDGTYWQPMSRNLSQYNQFDSLIYSQSYAHMEVGCDPLSEAHFYYDSLGAPISTHSENSCNDNWYEDCYYITTNEDSIYVIASSPLSYCAKDTIDIAVSFVGGTPPYTFQWSPQSNLLYPDSLNPGFICDTTTLYTLTITDSLGLTASDTLLLNVKPFFDFQISPSGTPCNGLAFSLSLTPPPSAQSYVQWFLNSGLQSTNDSLFPVVDGSYRAEISTPVGCIETTAPYLLQFVQPSVVNLGNDTILCTSDSLTLSVPGFTSYLWNDSSSLPYLIVSHPAGIADTMIYTILATDSNGCTSSDTLQVFYTVCASVTESDDERFDIFPNPSDGIFHLRFRQMTTNEKLTFIITDIAGRKVFQGELEDNLLIDLSDYPKGTYIIHMNANGNKGSRRLLIH